MEKKGRIQQFISDVKEEFTWKGFLTVVGAFLFSLSIIGLHNVVKNQFTLPLVDAFGATKAVVAIRDSWARVSGIMTAACMGAIYKKLGPRLLAWFGGATVVIGYLMMALTDSLTMVYIAHFIIGIGQAAAGGLMFFTIVKPWWNKAFGTFSALCGTASGIGGVLFVTTVTKTIQESGYKAGAMKIAVITGVLAFIGGILMTESPNDSLRNQEKAERAARARGERVEAQKVSLKKKVEVKDGVPALDYKDFLATPITWILMVLICMASFNVATAMFSPVAQWRGFAEPNVVGGAALTAYSALLIWTKLGAGALRDACGMKVVLPVMYIPAIICLFLNLFNMVSESMYPIVWALMAFSGTATQLLIGFLGVQAFGKYYNVKVHGIVTAVFNAFGIVVGPLRMLPHDVTGSFNITIILMIVFSFCIWFCGYLVLDMGKKFQAKMDEKYGLNKLETEAVPAEVK